MKGKLTNRVIGEPFFLHLHMPNFFKPFSTHTIPYDFQIITDMYNSYIVYIEFSIDSLTGSMGRKYWPPSNRFKKEAYISGKKSQILWLIDCHFFVVLFNIFYISSLFT